ncbi:helix-turn-helix domain-containing protein [Candidatus Enterovibrio escicola]|uniref:helix-turn-helix domain-containing protein n=1 Tax=Candidatus Enterovibrio escicola TaxID=1927127 RepID=UPI000BE37322
MVHNQLNDNDQFYIKQRFAEGYSFSQIFRRVSCIHSTISREIKRHIPNNFYGIYCHHLASATCPINRRVQSSPVMNKLLK